jgi:hypothetical protein
MEGIVLCKTSGGLRRLAGFFAEKGAGAFRFVRRRYCGPAKPIGLNLGVGRNPPGPLLSTEITFHKPT